MIASPAKNGALPKGAPPDSPLFAADQATHDAHRPAVGGEPPSTQPPRPYRDPKVDRGWVDLRIWAAMLHDAQKLRIAAEHRTRVGSGVFPEEYLPTIKMARAAERSDRNQLLAIYHIVAPPGVIAWQEANYGIGDVAVARLLGHLGHPIIAHPHAWVTRKPKDHKCDKRRCGKGRHLIALEPYERTVAQLWAYCGHGDPGRRRWRGMPAAEVGPAGSPICKTIVHEFLAKACVSKRQSPYRRFYDEAQERYADRDWPKGRKHNAALRFTGKAILKDLWLAAIWDGGDA